MCTYIVGFLCGATVERQIQNRFLYCLHSMNACKVSKKTSRSRPVKASVSSRTQNERSRLGLGEILESLGIGLGESYIESLVTDKKLEVSLSGKSEKVSVSFRTKS